MYIKLDHSKLGFKRSIDVAYNVFNVVFTLIYILIHSINYRKY